MRLLIQIVLIVTSLSALCAQDQKKVICKFENDNKTCNIEIHINSERFIIDAEENQLVVQLRIINEKFVNFLPENIAETFPSLTHYYVKFCSVKSVNTNHLKTLFQLEWLDLSKNQINSIASDSFKDLTKLKVLHLSENQIKAVDSKWFESLSTLKEISFASNKIQMLDENVFKNLPNLEQLYLSHNNLTLIPETLLKHNLKLEWIAFENNQIIRINNASMFDNDELLTVNLKGNICVNGQFSQFVGDNYPGVRKITELKKELIANCAGSRN